MPFGGLEQVTLQRDVENPTRSKGYGFVQYVSQPPRLIAYVNGVVGSKNLLMPRRHSLK
jgi:hypothetical protein